MDKNIVTGVSVLKNIYIFFNNMWNGPQQVCTLKDVPVLCNLVLGFKSYF